MTEPELVTALAALLDMERAAVVVVLLPTIRAYKEQPEYRKCRICGTSLVRTDVWIHPQTFLTFAQTVGTIHVDHVHQPEETEYEPE